MELLDNDAQWIKIYSKSDDGNNWTFFLACPLLGLNLGILDFQAKYLKIDCMLYDFTLGRAIDYKNIYNSFTNFLDADMAQYISTPSINKEIELLEKMFRVA